MKMDGVKSVNPLVERSPSPACLAYTSEKHPRACLAEINLLRSHRELCDVVLNVGIRKIFAHRYVLLHFLHLSMSFNVCFFFSFIESYCQHAALTSEQCLLVN